MLRLIFVFLSLVLNVSCSDSVGTQSSHHGNSAKTIEETPTDNEAKNVEAPDKEPSLPPIPEPALEPPITVPDCSQNFDEAFALSFASQNTLSVKQDAHFSLSTQAESSASIYDYIVNVQIKESLAAQFQLGSKYNQAVNDTYNDCLIGRKKDPKFKCQSITNSEVHAESVARWIEFDYLLSKFKSSYGRLLDYQRGASGISSLSEDSSASRDYAKTLKGELESFLVDQLKPVRLTLSEADSHKKYLDYAASAELMAVINETRDEYGLSPLLDIDIEQIYSSNREAYKAEALKKSSRTDQSLLFKSIKKSIQDEYILKSLSVDWVNVTGRRFKDGEFALTYDDGPRNSTTSVLLNYLSSDAVEKKLGYKPHATFFWQAINISKNSNQDVISRAKDLGFGLASHSYSHEDFSSFIKNGKLAWCTTNSSGKNISLKKQLLTSKEDLEEAYGKQLNYFRLPYGSGLNTPAIRDQISRFNMIHFFWNVNADDWRWRSVSPKTIEQNYIKEIYKAGKGVVLLHDIHSNTTGPLTKALVEYFATNSHGFKIVPLEKAVMDNIVNVPANGPFRTN